MLNRPIPKSSKLGVVGLLVVIITGVFLLPMAKAEKVSDETSDKPTSVRLVVSSSSMTFEGQQVSWEKLPSLLEKISNRSNTIFEMAITTKKIDFERYEDAKNKAGKLVEQFGFESLSFVGVKPMGSKGGSSDSSEPISATKIREKPRTIRAKPVAGGSPIVVSTTPVVFANDVSPELKKITVTFDQPMMNLSWSWVGGGDTYPETTGKPRYDHSKTTCSLPVKLEPGKVYWIGINSPQFNNFQTEMGVPAAPYAILFATKDKDDNPTPIPDDFIKEAREINIPPQEAKAPANKEQLIEAAVDCAVDWLKLVDDGQYDKSWDEAAEFFKKSLPKKQWNTALKISREPLGKLISRELISTYYATELPAAPDGEYVVITFKATYENKEAALDQVTPMLEKDGTWRVSGYYIS